MNRRPLVPAASPFGLAFAYGSAEARRSVYSIECLGGLQGVDCADPADANDGRQQALGGRECGHTSFLAESCCLRDVSVPVDS